MNNDDPRQFAWIVIITVLCSTIVWITATLLTAPEREEVLLSFYRRVRPSAFLWGPVARKATDVMPERGSAFLLLDWICGCALVYLTLFGVGNIIFGKLLEGAWFLFFAALAGGFIYWDLNRRGWKSVTD